MRGEPRRVAVAPSRVWEGGCCAGGLRVPSRGKRVGADAGSASTPRADLLLLSPRALGC